MSSVTPEGLIPISLASLSSTATVGADIYLKAGADSKPILFFARDQIPNLAMLAPLAGYGVTKLYIDRCDREHYQRYLRENWQLLIADDAQPIVNRVAIMSELIRDVLSEQFRAGNTAEIVDVSRQLAQETCKLIGQQPIVVRHLCNVLHHDYATFTHCTNVALYCVMLARALGFSAEELPEIALGGLLHDLGKLHIDESILAKPERLDQFEFREIQKHPALGFSELICRDDLSLGQMMMVYQHHERLNGTGYPVACVGEEIHVWARLCAVVDVYEALTSHRPYRLPMTYKTALAVLESGSGTEFDAEMVNCWHQLILQKA